MTRWTVPGVVPVRQVREDAIGRRVIARYPMTRKFVSITYLSQEFLADAEFRSRFRREAAQLAQMRDARVERVRRYVECGDGAAVVTDYLPGTLLRTLLREEGIVSTEAALVLFKDMLLGLTAGHAAGLVHGDVKPEGMLLTRAGGLRLLDFGLVTRAGRRLCARATPFYLAPEQWNGAAITQPGDVYAATVTFFECLAGGPPFHADNPAELSALHQQGAPPLEAVPRPVQQLVRSGLAKDPGNRPAAQQLLARVDQEATCGLGPDWERRGRRELISLLAGSSRPSHGCAPAGLLGRFGWRHWRPVRFAVVLGGSLLVAAGMSSPLSFSGWLSQSPGVEGQPPVRAFPGLPGGIAGFRTGAGTMAVACVPPQPAAMVARAEPDAAPIASAAHVPLDDLSSDPQWALSERIGPQLSGIPRTAPTPTANPTPEPTPSATEAPGEPSTSAPPPPNPESIQPGEETGEPTAPSGAPSDVDDPVADVTDPADQPDPSHPDPSDTPDQVDLVDQQDPSSFTLEELDQPADQEKPLSPDQPADPD